MAKTPGSNLHAGGRLQRGDCRGLGSGVGFTTKETKITEAFIVIHFVLVVLFVVYSTAHMAQTAALGRGDPFGPRILTF